MSSYLQIPFLQALGYAIANSLWQVALLWLITILVNSVAKHSSHVKYITALSAQAGGFVWFITTFQFYFTQCNKALEGANSELTQNGTVYTSPVISSEWFLSVLWKAEATLPYLSLAYILLLLLLVAKWVGSYRSTHLLSASVLGKAEAGLQTFVNEMADQIGILQKVTVYVSSAAKSPLTIGYIKPVILLPLASVNHLSRDQMEAVLIHELAHIKRSDYIINLFISLTEILLFFNPFTRLLSRQIHQERENCCDDWVLHYQYDAAMYAEALVRIACLQKKEGMQMNAAAQPKGELLQRVKRMIQPGEKAFNYKHHVAALMLITLLLCSIAWLQPAEGKLHPRYAYGYNNGDPKMIAAPAAHGIQHPFFSPSFVLSRSLRLEPNQPQQQAQQSVESQIDTLLHEAVAASAVTMPDDAQPMSEKTWHPEAQEAKEEAVKSLASADWEQIRFEAPQFIDSAFIFKSLKDAFAAKPLQIEITKKALEAARAELEALKENNFSFYFDQAAVRQLTKDALAAVKDATANAVFDSLVISEKNRQHLLRIQKDVQRKAQQNEWLLQRKRAERQVAMIAAHSKAVVHVPPPPALHSMAQTITLIECEENMPPPPVPPVLIASAPIAGFANAIYSPNAENNPASVSRSVRVRDNASGTAVNIVIEIRQ